MASRTGLCRITRNRARALRMRQSLRHALRSHARCRTRPSCCLFQLQCRLRHRRHVAVITAVDVASQSVKVVEQNFANSRWPSDYARKLDLLSKDGHYWLLDAYLLGWKSIQQ